MKALILLTQFLTRIPLPLELDVTEEDFSKAITYFTTVGVILAGLLFFVYYLLNSFFEPLSLAVILVFFHIFITGGLHLDGVADAADGLFSNREPERMLEIMRDSRIGSNGVIALIVVISLKVVFIYELLLKAAPLYLVIMPIIGRFAVVWAAYLGKTPHSKGMGNLFIGKVKSSQLALNLVPLLFLFYFLPLSIAAFIAVVVYTYLIVRWSTAKVGGITGDVLGAAIEMGEVLSLLIVIMLIK